MRRQFCFLLLVTLVMSAFAFALRLRLEQRRLAAGLIRLHIVAESDAEADQQTKLRVRDAVLPVIETLTKGSPDADSARAALLGGLPAIRAAAERVLSDRGAGATGDGRAADPREETAPPAVRVMLTEESFPRREYDTFSLPAGRYPALRVTLGRGEGHNWWCVAFPALCLPATVEDFAETAQEAGLDGGQIRLLTSDDETVRIKFRILDWIESLFG